MKRRIRIIEAAILLACLLTVLLWARSLFRADSLSRNDHADGDQYIQSVYGIICFGRSFHGEIDAIPHYGWEWWSGSPNTTAPPNRWKTLGFGFAYYSEFPPGAGSGASWVIAIPYWPIAGVLAALFYWQIRAKRNHHTSFCSQCGYDLRGGHERCPECGKLIPQEKQTGKDKTS